MGQTFSATNLSCANHLKWTNLITVEPSVSQWCLFSSTRGYLEGGCRQVSTAGLMPSG